MHPVFALTLLVLLVETVSSDSCSKSCTLPSVLYEATCVCLPTYVKQSCIRGDKDRCSRVINAGLCGTVTYAAACANGCGLCDADYIKPTGPQVFFGPDASARDLFDVDCGSPPGLADGTVAPTSTTFTSIARYTCDIGYQMAGHGLSKCQHDGTWSSLASVCNDIDECDTNTDNCHAAATCTNNRGSFSCACNAGYSGNGVICAGTNECTRGTHDCDANAACTSITSSSFSCACNSGFTGNGRSCTDVNECTSSTHDCDANAACTNNPGSFSCACNSGYTGNGTSCTDVNECTSSTHDCDANAACTNNPSSFSCACNSGYTGNGRSCTDVNECTGGTHDCDANATCTNNIGSFSCACNPGYGGDGRLCSVTTDECALNIDNCPNTTQCFDAPYLYKCGTWVSAYISVSSEYGGSYGASRIIGTPSVYPYYGDRSGVWQQSSSSSRRIEWIVVQFGTSLVMNDIDIYETYHSGHVTKLETQRPSGDWFTLWSSSSVTPLTRSRIFSPTFQAMPTFASDTLKLTTEPRGHGWVNIDAVRIYGRPAI